MQSAFQKQFTLWVLSLFLATQCTISFAAQCVGKGVELQVLGSGGPELQQKRASSSYLIWFDGKAKVLIDAGGGSALRFGESGAQMADLDAILLTHLHADHTADLPALVKSSYFESRLKPLPVFGPQGNQLFPDTQQFVQLLFGNNGAYRYLSDYTQANNSHYWLTAHNVTAMMPKQVLKQAELSISAVDVQHGSVPALAWRVDLQARSIVISGDTNGANGNLGRIANQADVLVAHNAVPEAANGVARRLHMPPSLIGKVANEAKVKQLVLSHRMLRTLGREDETRQLISNSYLGNINFANDLDCFSL